jgi:Uma2 family endonuclease
MFMLGNEQILIYSGIPQMSNVATKPITADELLKMGDIGRCELIYGELVMMSPAGFGHGEIALRIGRFLGNFVEDRDLGVVLAAETGFLVERAPDLVRAPDASFVRKDRLPKAAWNKFFPGVPDLAVEVMSPDDTKREIAEKVNMWLAHGTTSVWVADPAAMTLMIHRSGQKPIRLTVRDEINKEPALPGLILPVSRIFRRP